MPYFILSISVQFIFGTITRIGVIVPGSPLVYNIFQNVDKSFNTALELILSQNISKQVTLNLNVNGNQHIIDPFTCSHKYPVEIFLARPGRPRSRVAGKDLIPFSIDAGVKKIL